MNLGHTNTLFSPSLSLREDGAKLTSGTMNPRVLILQAAMNSLGSDALLALDQIVDLDLLDKAILCKEVFSAAYQAPESKEKMMVIAKKTNFPEVIRQEGILRQWTEGSFA